MVGQDEAPLEPATLKVAIPFGESEAPYVEAVIDDFAKMHPELTIEVTRDVTDQQIIAGLRSGDSADVAVSWELVNVGQFCAPGGFDVLGPWLERDGVDMANFAEATLYYTQFAGVRCALPLLADAYGLYYNKALFEEAGIDGPPKTITEPTDAAKKLTKRNDDGSLAVVGLDPMFGFYQFTPSRLATMFGADWVDAEGNSSFSTDPAWARGPDVAEGAHRLLRLRRPRHVQCRCRRRVLRLQRLPGRPPRDEHRWRVADRVHRPRSAGPRLWDGARAGGRTTSPTCTVRATSTARSWNPGNAANKEQAWALVKYLTTDDAALAKLSNGLRNVPSTKTSGQSPDLVPDENFSTFLEIFAHPASSTTPVTAVGSAYQDLVNAFVSNWQAGSVPDLAAGLTDLDQQIDDQLAAAGG